MAFKTANRREEKATVSGTAATVTLNGATFGNATFASAGLSAGDTFTYALVQDNTGAWEIGKGTWVGPSSYTRASTVENSSTGAVVSFSGVCTTFITFSSLDIDGLRSSNPSRAVFSLDFTGNTSTGVPIDEMWNFDFPSTFAPSTTDSVTQITMPAARPWGGPVYGGGVWVVRPGGPTNVVATSTDDFTWTSRSLPANQSWNNPVYANGIWVLSPTDGSATLASSDGINWNDVGALPAVASWNAPVYANGLWVLSASTVSTSTVMTSANGITWTSRALPSSAAWDSPVYANGLWVLSASTVSTSTVMTSANGITWASRALPSSKYWGTPVYANGLWVLPNTEFTNVLATSTDGLTWTSRTLPSTTTWKSFPVYANGIWVLVAANSTTLATSTDGITWISRTHYSPGPGSPVYANGLWVLTGEYTNRLSTSPDGITWTSRTLPLTQYWRDPVYANGVWVISPGAGANSSTAAISSNGTTWTSRTLPASQLWGSPTYANGVLVLAPASNSSTGAVLSPTYLTLAMPAQSTYSAETIRWVPAVASGKTPAQYAADLGAYIKSSRFAYTVTTSGNTVTIDTNSAENIANLTSVQTGASTGLVVTLTVADGGIYFDTILITDQANNSTYQYVPPAQSTLVDIMNNMALGETLPSYWFYPSGSTTSKSRLGMERISPGVATAPTCTVTKGTGSTLAAVVSTVTLGS